MHAAVAERLLQVNREFYQAFARPFAETRRRLQPGAAELVRGLPPDACVLDLGCGSGEVPRALARRLHRGAYLGIDDCDSLLDEARACGLRQATFLLADLAAPGWPEQTHPPYDYALALAVLHHLPGESRRGRVRRVGAVFADSRRACSRSPSGSSRPVSGCGDGSSRGRRSASTAAQVDPGDFLLDWRHGGRGLRYVHAFDDAELAALAGQAGFRPVRTFLSDGQGGRLGRYEVWTPASSDVAPRPAQGPAAAQL